MNASVLQGYINASTLFLSTLPSSLFCRWCCSPLPLSYSANIDNDGTVRTTSFAFDLGQICAWNSMGLVSFSASKAPDLFVILNYLPYSPQLNVDSATLHPAGSISLLPPPINSSLCWSAFLSKFATRVARSFFFTRRQKPFLQSSPPLLSHSVQTRPTLGHWSSVRNYFYPRSGSTKGHSTDQRSLWDYKSPVIFLLGCSGITHFSIATTFGFCPSELAAAIPIFTCFLLLIVFRRPVVLIKSSPLDAELLYFSLRLFPGLKALE